ncbi:MAG TPA: DUF4266 domain-containing protein [Povalibacter sp.]|nr:DUF4266 domain-containing protein [Povalibacter sp.]
MEADSGLRIADSQNAATAASSAIATRNRIATMPTSLRRVLVLAPLLLAASACGNIEPWVKPYERQNLADPVMSFDLNPVSSAYIDHVYEAREGARGALGSAGGGCGCN